MKRADYFTSTYPKEGMVTWPAARTHADGLKVDHYCTGKSMTDQSQADAANINIIVATYGGVHNIPPGSRVPTWGDFTNVPTDRAVIAQQMKNAQDGFMALPPSIRALANNDLETFLEMLEDDGARAAMEQLGLSKFIHSDQVRQGETPAPQSDNQPDPAGVTQTN